MSAAQQLDSLAGWLVELRSGRLSPAEFSGKARSNALLLAALPPRYGEVLLSLLDRLEAGALFTEESCSFSVEQLHEGLAQWLAKARQQLVHTP